MGKLRYGSVCSGIEAASCAWHPLGWRASFVSEIEPFPRAVLKHRWPEIPLHGDFTTIQAGEYDPIDLLVGGTPCQSFSVAGLRGGLDDERGNLALEYLRLADRLRPRWLVWENVPGVLSSAGGRDFGAILGGMVELGYGVAYRVLDAQFFGVAQRRRRVFVVGHLGDWRRAAAVLFERHGLQGHPAPRREAREGVAPTISARTKGGGGLGTDFDCDGGLIDVAPTLNATYGEQTGQDYMNGTLAFGWQNSASQGDSVSEHFAPSLDKSKTPAVFTLAVRGRGDGHQLEFRDDGTANAILTPNGGRAGMGVGAVAFDTTQITSAANYSRPQPGDPCHPLAAGAHPPAVAFNITPSNSNRDYNAREAQYAQAVTGSGGRPSARGGDLIAGTVRSHTRPGSNEVGSIVATSAVRRLTPRECERLQGFPDDYTLIPMGRRNKSAEAAELAAFALATGQDPDLFKWSADGPRYKALGNSMAVPCMAWIGHRIEAVEAISVQAVAA